MDRIEDVDVGSELPVRPLRAVLEESPVRLAVLFGSHASGRPHDQSDVDVAIELPDVEPGDPGYNDEFFGISAEIAEALGTDNVDVVDLHSLSPSIARSVFENGVLLVGSVERAETLRKRLIEEPESNPDRAPRDRIDDALRRIDEHLA